MPGTEHPCAGLTKRQREVFEQVAVNQQPVAPHVLKRLHALGLIDRHERTLPGHPPVKVYEYAVPLALHMQWCAWAAEQRSVED